MILLSLAALSLTMGLTATAGSVATLFFYRSGSGLAIEDDKWTRLGIGATVPLLRPDKFIWAAMDDVDLSAHEITGE